MNSVNCIAPKKTSIIANNKKYAWSHISSIFDSAKPIYYFSKLLGFAAFQLPKSLPEKQTQSATTKKNCGKHRVHVTPIDLIIFIVCLVVYIILIYWNFKTGSNSMARSSSVIMDMGGQAVLLAGLLIAVLSILMNFIYRCDVIKILYIMHDFDSELKDVGCCVDYTNQYKWAAIITFSGVAFTCVAMTLTYFALNQSVATFPLLYISYMIQNAAFSLLMTHYILFLLAVKVRFGLLNKGFSYYYGINDEIPIAPSPTTMYQHTMNAGNMLDIVNLPLLVTYIAKLHDKLNDIVELINFCYSFQAMNIIAISFGYIILNFFAWYRVAFHADDDARMTSLAFVYFIWCVYYFAYDIGLMAIASATTSEGKHTGVLIHKAVNSTADKALIEKLKLFSLQLKQRAPIITSGLFTFDWTLLYAIIGAAVTYLIILIQFDSAMSTSSATCHCPNVTTTGPLL